MTPTSRELQAVRSKLIAAWESIPDSPAPHQVEELARRAEAVVYLVGWLDERPRATRADYQQELARVRRDGVAWPATRAIPATMPASMPPGLS